MIFITKILLVMCQLIGGTSVKRSTPYYDPAGYWHYSSLLLSEVCRLYSSCSLFQHKSVEPRVTLATDERIFSAIRHLRRRDVFLHYVTTSQRLNST